MIFFNGGTMTDVKVMNILKAVFPLAKYVLYLADSVKGKKQYESIFGMFNRVITLDRNDYDFYNPQNILAIDRMT
ncbi:MAG: hypothetical protein RR496_05420 [Lachnospiraceae bacterium]